MAGPRKTKKRSPITSSYLTALRYTGVVSKAEESWCGVLGQERLEQTREKRKIKAKNYDEEKRERKEEGNHRLIPDTWKRKPRDLLRGTKSGERARDLPHKDAAGVRFRQGVTIIIRRSELGKHSKREWTS